ncbi:MAG: thioredoxin [Ignavibacteria bacterium]|nr:thioredoxin [Ignavibacteria bacterium]
MILLLSFNSSSEEKPSQNTKQETEKKFQLTETNKKNEKNMEYLTEQTFKEKVFNYDVNTEWKYEGDMPCIVDFYADWCGPCKMISPILEELATEYDGKIKIYKVDTDKEQNLAAIFGIRSIPSLLFIPKEGTPQMAVGAMSKDGFVQAINEILLKQQ